jgi:plasmid stability protein
MSSSLNGIEGSTRQWAIGARPADAPETHGSLTESWKAVSVKTTLDISDDLLRAMKMRAVQEGRKFKDVAAEIFRRGLAQPNVAANSGVKQRVKLPLIQCRHPADSPATLMPDQVADVLLKQELEWSHEATRR